jgi:rhamnogalacturonyl hydrolase YesR
MMKLPKESLPELARDSLNRLYIYCKDRKWTGYDPYDGLNSRLFQSAPFFRNHKIFRLCFLQLNKVSKINLRPVLLVPQGRSPKGTGLFLAATVNLYKREKRPEYLSLIDEFVRWLKEDVSPGYSGNCWGHNFSWQSRAFFLPKGTPTVVNTSFVGRALLSAYEVFGREEYLHTARSACDFILNDLHRVEDHNTVCFSYSPLDHYFVHNATALGSSLLASTYKLTREENLALVARKSIQYVINHQRPEGFWPYGENSVAQKTGIDSFHSGFILENIKIYSESTGDRSYDQNLKEGLKFYQENFFLGDGSPKYYFNKTYPLDIHSASQAVISLLQLKEYGADQVLLQKVIFWMINKMQDRQGYFYYQKKKHYKNKISYMRWAQAWALLALSLYLNAHES